MEPRVQWRLAWVVVRQLVLDGRVWSADRHGGVVWLRARAKAERVPRAPRGGDRGQRVRQLGQLPPYFVVRSPRAGQGAAQGIVSQNPGGLFLIRESGG